MKRKLLLLGGSGLVGRALSAALEADYQIVPTGGNRRPKNGYLLRAEEPDRLLEVLEREAPAVVVSSIRGDFQAQIAFHRALADWMAGRDGRLLYISTANVFDGDLSRPWTEADPPAAASDYGRFKGACETMLRERLGERLAVFRLATVWDSNCPRVRQLEERSRRGEPHPTCPGCMVNVTLAEQIGAYAEYVLRRDLHGVFHVGTTDMVEYPAFEKMVCEVLGVPPPEFVGEAAGRTAFQAVLPTRREIPDALQLTVAQAAAALGRRRLP